MHPTSGRGVSEHADKLSAERGWKKVIFAAEGGKSPAAEGLVDDGVDFIS